MHRDPFLPGPLASQGAHEKVAAGALHAFGMFSSDKLKHFVLQSFSGLCAGQSVELGQHNQWN